MPPTDHGTVEGHWRDRPSRFRNDRLIVSVRRGSSVSRALDEIRSSLAHDLADIEFTRRRGRRWVILQFSPPADAEERIPAIAARIAALHDIEYAEPDFAGSGHFEPNDPIFRAQCWPRRIQIGKVWDVTTGADHVILAILDSGICVSGWSPPGHTDFKPLTGGMPRFITRHYIGIELFTHNYVWSFPFFGFMLAPRDGHGHGTHVAGIASATGNNNEGVAGANWGSPVYIARVLDDSNTGYVSDVKLAVDDLLRFVAGPPWAWLFHFWAPRKRVVINLSLGFQDYSSALEQICTETDNKRVMICVAAGSLGTSMTEIDYPASFASLYPHVIAVGSVTCPGTPAETEKVDLPILDDYSAITLFAPGVDIPSTIPGYPTALYAAPAPNSYARQSGTSQACPIVAGAISLLWSIHRRLLPRQIRRGLIETAVPVAAAGGTYPRINLADFEKIRPHPWFWPPWW